LTLCGERFAQCYSLRPSGALQGLWQRLSPPRANTTELLGAL